MKKNRIILTVFLIVCLLIGWVGYFTNQKKNKQNYSTIVNQAREYYQDGLSQKAITAYESALAIMETEEIEDELLLAYERGLEEGVVSGNEFILAYEVACRRFPKNTHYWEALIEYYLVKQNYSSAFISYQAAKKAGANSDVLDELSDQITFAFSSRSRGFEAAFMAPNGIFTVAFNEKWGIILSNGDDYRDCAYDYISPISSEGWSAVLSAKGIRVFDNKGIVQYVLSQPFTLSRAYGNERIPICCEDGTWTYYDCAKDACQTQKYESASAFTNGYAAVETSGEWKLIDVDDNQVGVDTFEDIKLYQNGEYTFDDTMIAKADGKYQVFSASGDAINSFSAKDMDNYYGGYIAFQADDGRWGFVDRKGDIVIEPQFVAAKSFSNGLAAVYDGNYWGFINPNGKNVIGCQFVDAFYFTSSGVCVVCNLKGSYSFIQLRTYD